MARYRVHHRRPWVSGWAKPFVLDNGETGLRDNREQGGFDIREAIQDRRTSLKQRAESLASISLFWLVVSLAGSLAIVALHLSPWLFVLMGIPLGLSLAARSMGRDVMRLLGNPAMWP